MPTHERTVCRLRVHGLVQGVGFRPYVHRLATTLKLCGWVHNDDAGVLIHLEGEPELIETFRARLQRQTPDAAHIESIFQEPANCEELSGFHIRFAAASQPLSPRPLGEGVGVRARVPADRVMCSMCRAEVLDPASRRHRHPFATCTVCGPRYAILHCLPYERQHTSMHTFRMCSVCRAEYVDPENRRFHAEPIACSDCGPRLTFRSASRQCADWQAVVAAAESLRAGKIVALKGLGGYQLLVRADDHDAVMRLRQRKQRPTKPFAVMVSSIEQAEKLAQISPRERELLVSSENPIVILRNRIPGVRSTSPLGLGLLLPTTPLHELLLSLVDFPVVATSGNQCEEPIVIDEKQHDSLAAIADAFLNHDRPIVRRVDDSVVRIIDEQPMIFRLARGYAPCSLPALERWALSTGVPIPPMLAVGGQQKTAVALWTGSQAILSAHLGDMDHPAARCAFATAVSDLADLYGCDPQIVISDLHPDYYTTRWAQAAGKPVWQVQHHHAHAASCMAEHDLLDRDVLAITWDGTGLGTDGSIWGGEFLHASTLDFQRMASLDPFALPGGESAIHEPSRIALSLLAETYGAERIPAWLLERLGLTAQRARLLVQMIEREVNAPRTSSVGRLFDGVAALLLQVQTVSYEGEAALWLEANVDPTEDAAYPIAMHKVAGTRSVHTILHGDWRPLMRALVDDLANAVDVGICAARFHNALAQWAGAIAATSPKMDVILSGGCFQNAWLTRRTCAAIVNLGKTVYMPNQIPANDGGLAVGQLAIGMARWLRQAKDQ